MGGGGNLKASNSSQVPMGQLFSFKAILVVWGLGLKAQSQQNVDWGAPCPGFKSWLYPLLATPRQQIMEPVTKPHVSYL